MLSESLTTYFALPHLADWLNLALRWGHLVAGISWIGSSFYFMWLDSHLEAPDSKSDRVEGQLWMVHSGGFYQVEKRRIAPGQLPRVLHWFKWEAMLTWLTGVFLLGLIYHTTDGIFLVDPAVWAISPAMASLFCLGVMVGSWLVYDLFWISSLARNTRFAQICSMLFLGALAFGLCQALSGRGAFIHLGAVIGTVMVLNVWVRILPAQRQMIQATQEGRLPDEELGRRAKRRSVHNSYLTLPVLFVMLSNHYPATFGHPQNWLILLLMIGIGASIRHLMLTGKRWLVIPIGMAVVIVIGLTSPAATREQVRLGDPMDRVQFAEVRAIIHQRCQVCHSRNPEDSTFGVAPGGISFDRDLDIARYAERIKFRAVITKTMPLVNRTQITPEERERLGVWVDQGAHLE